MVIQSDKISDQVSDFEEMNPQETSFDGTYLKTCVDCGTTKTPLWRGGPSGPKSLCNACGIRSRKKRRALMGIINKEDKKPKKSTMIKHNNQQINNISISSSSSSSEESSSKYDEISLKKKKKKKLLAFGGKVAYQRPRSNSINKKRKLGEVEQAAFLLMFLSCAPVYA